MKDPTPNPNPNHHPDQDGPKLLEYNCRMGDPETQVLYLTYISLYLPISPCSSLPDGRPGDAGPISPYISLYLPISHYISL